MNSTVYFGLAVGVGADTEMATAEFSNVVITSLESGDPIPTAYVKPVATGTGDGFRGKTPRTTWWPPLGA
jgi:hypothetical protein